MIINSKGYLKTFFGPSGLLMVENMVKAILREIFIFQRTHKTKEKKKNHLSTG